MNYYYKIKDNGDPDIKLSEEAIDGYSLFELGEEPEELNQALLNEVQKRKDLKASYQYLNDTDWYYIRKLERNVEVPADVVTKRAESIQFIQDNE